MGMVPILEKTMSRVNTAANHSGTCEGLYCDDSATGGANLSRVELAVTRHVSSRCTVKHCGITFLQSTLTEGASFP